MIEGRGFKKKTVERIIRNKVESWIKHVDDESVKTLIKENYILTGGAITSLLLGDNPNDFDIYFKDRESAIKIAQYYLEKVKKVEQNVIVSIDTNKLDRISIMIKSVGIIQNNDENKNYEYFEQNQENPEVSNRIESYLNKTNTGKNVNKYDVLMITSNAITLTNDVQLVFRFFGTPSEIHKNYDFVHVTNYFTESEGLVLNIDALESIMSKTLRYVGSLYPICSLFRIRKFIKRGWSISAGEILKMSFDVNKLDLNDPVVLYEQLIGVDVAYFNQLIGMIKDFQKKNKDVPIERSYLFELINKVFDDQDDISSHEDEIEEGISI
jgi:hypothetical protein